jgi:hypothetical protein
VEVSAVNVRDPNEIERAVMTFAQTSNGGLIGTGSALAVIHRQRYTDARYKLPAVYFQRFFVTNGGLISYGPSMLRPDTSIESSRARSQPIFRFKFRPNTTW